MGVRLVEVDVMLMARVMSEAHWVPKPMSKPPPSKPPPSKPPPSPAAISAAAVTAVATAFSAVP